MTETGTSPIRMLVVDDHAVVRQALRGAVEAEPDMTVCCEAEDAAHALDTIGRCRPHLVLIDLSLGEGNGLSLVRDVRARFPRLPILVLSPHSTSLLAERAVAAGTDGYLLKHDAPEGLVPAIRAVLRGEQHLSAAIQDRVPGTTA